MVTIPNRAYRFKRMMGKVVNSCTVKEYQNVGIVCLSCEEIALHSKIMNYINTEPRPMTSSLPLRCLSYHGAACLIYTDTNSSVSILSELEDWQGRLFESIYIVCNVHEMKAPVRRYMGSAILSATVNVNLGNPETYNWS